MSGAEAKRQAQREYNRQYYLKNKARLLEINKKYHEENPQVVADAKRKYYERNSEKVKAAARLWASANPEKQADAIRSWRSRNKERCLAYDNNRRAKEKQNGGQLSPGLAGRLRKLQRNKCAICKASLNDGMHMDHIEPIAKGGANADENIQLLCPKCNRTKSDKDPIEFMQAKGFLL